MEISYNKLKGYFDERLPEPEKVAELLTFYSYEVEDLREENSDYIFDIDVLPNRQGDSKSEEGVARELSAILNIPLSGLAAKWSESDIKIDVSVSQINKLLGANISVSEVENIFKRLKFRFDLNGEKFTIIPPVERTDLKIKADMIEEVGRMYGYKNIEATLPEEPQKVPRVNKKFYYSNKIKQFLANEGFSEVYTYTFRDKGDIEIIKPVASDKNFLRTDLRGGLEKALERNTKNLPLLDCSEVKIFEIGNVFTKDEEYTSLSVVDAEDIVQKLSDFLGVDIEEESKENIFEINLDKLLEKLPEPENKYEYSGKKESIAFKPISPYPFMLRDIAVWVPADKVGNDVLEIIKKEAGNLLVNTKLFDEFKKNNKISYAFNLAFQSSEKTLSDEDVNKIMDKVTTTLNSNSGWEVR